MYFFVDLKQRFGVCSVPLPIPLGIPPEQYGSLYIDNQRPKLTVVDEILVT
jgi:hypothetical protein